MRAAGKDDEVAGGPTMTADIVVRDAAPDDRAFVALAAQRLAGFGPPHATSKQKMY